jgi:hypothetical protein
MSLADILERAAAALPEDADAIRPANGDPIRLLEELEPEAATRVVVWLLSNEPEEGVDLALSWADEEGGAAILGEIDDKRLPKAGRKSLRKALHRLRSRGVEVPRNQVAEPVVSRLPEIEPEFEEGHVSALDPRGGRLIYILESNPAGGARLFEVLCDEDRGVVDFQVYAAARGKIRSFLKHALENARFPLVEAPVPALRALIARIEAVHPADRVLPPSFVEHRARVVGAGDTPGDLVVKAVGASDDDGALDRANELVRSGAIGPWGPVGALLAKRVEGQLEAASKREPGEEDWPHIAGLVFCDEATCEATRHRLHESAYVFWKRDQEPEARAFVAGAEAFATQSAAENSLAAAMVETLLGQAVTGLRDRAAAASSADATDATDEAEAEAGPETDD